jgi:hypothetical protein
MLVWAAIARLSGSVSDVDGPPEVIDERGKAELGPDIVESLHQEGCRAVA